VPIADILSLRSPLQQEPQNILSGRSQSIELLFAPHRAHQTKLSYFCGCIDFARCDAEIGRLATIDRLRKVTEQLASQKTSRRRHLCGLPAKSEESPMTHKLNSPHEWLLEKAQDWNTDALYKALSGLARRLDGQSIRDLFHSEMGNEGYFDKQAKPNADPFDAESWGSHRWHT
jgi:hypothetical protein